MKSYDLKPWWFFYLFEKKFVLKSAYFINHISDRGKYLLLAVILILISVMYHLWLYPKLLLPITPVQSITDLNWDCIVVQCNEQKECALSPGASHKSLIVGKFDGTIKEKFVLVYDLRMNIHSSMRGDSNKINKLVLISENDGSRQWDKPHQFFEVANKSLISHKGRLYFNEPVQRFQLLIDVADTENSIVISQLNFYIAEESIWNKTLLITLLIIWGCFFFYSLYLLTRESSLWNTPIVLMIFLIMLGTQLPNSCFSPIKSWLHQAHKKHFLDSSETVTNPVKPTKIHTESSLNFIDDENPVIALKKLAHFVLFAVFFLLLWLKFRNRLHAIFWSVVFSMLFAIETEVIQSLGKVRSASITDIAIDMAGVIFIITFILFFKLYRYAHR